MIINIAHNLHCCTHSQKKNIMPMYSSSLFVFCSVFTSFPLILLGECVFEPETDGNQNLLRKHMEGSWKFNEELSTALGHPIPYFEEAKYVEKDKEFV